MNDIWRDWGMNENQRQASEGFVLVQKRNLSQLGNENNQSKVRIGTWIL